MILSDLDIEPILFLSGDLPYNYEPLEFYNTIPILPDITDITDFPPPEVVRALEIKDRTQTNRSYVVVMLYNDLIQRDNANTALVFSTGWGAGRSIAISNVGESAYLFEKHTGGYEAVTFLRCKALVYMLTTSDTFNYAQKLDERLTPVVCR